MNTITECRVCKNTDLKDVIHLGDQYITSRFPVYGDFSTPKTQIDLCLCETCCLVQLKLIIDQNELYKHEYGYLSGISNTMRTHLKQYQEEVLTIVANIKEGDTIIDIGSNDATTLKYYPSKYQRIGIDPTGSQFQKYYTDGVELIADYFTLANFQNKYGSDKRVKVVSSICMFYDLPDPIQFANDVYDILEDDGIWTCEQSYLLTMLRRNSIDTICHEHLEYYSLTTIKYIADKCNFKIINISFNESNGGSFRLYFAKKDSTKYTEIAETIDAIIKEESEYGINDVKTYFQFVKNCDREISLLKKCIDMIQTNDKTAYIYGASTKGNCLLQYADITEKDAKYAVERNENKVGKMTNTGIEIISEATMREKPPDYLLVLPYHFRNEIIEREQEFLKNGGQFLFPFPKFEIVSYNKKVLITGCDGFIANYVKEKYRATTDYSLYGIAHHHHHHHSSSSPPTHTEKYITKTHFDMNDSQLLEETILTIKPDILIHLAGISNSQPAFNQPLLSLNTNGGIISNICSIIHTNKLQTKVFNASSSEIFKGHNDYFIKEDDTNYYYNHPYAIGKIAGHSMVDFYREQYALPFSNGIIFTTESKLKKSTFLLNKVAQHIKQCNTSHFVCPLTLGPLLSHRNIIHPVDVANAIYTILEQDTGTNYNICGEESHRIIDIVRKMYQKRGIVLYEEGNIFYDKDTNKPVIIIEDSYNGLDKTIINIRGEPTKLKALSWKPTKTIDDIIDEILED
jgi:GDP-mannose 4,6-dehydratase